MHVTRKVRARHIAVYFESWWLFRDSKFHCCCCGQQPVRKRPYFFLHIRLAPVTIWWGGGASMTISATDRPAWLWTWWWLHEGKEKKKMKENSLFSAWWYEKNLRVPIRAKNAAQLPQRLHAERGTVERVKREASSSIFLFFPRRLTNNHSFALPRLLLLLRAVS